MVSPLSAVNCWVWVVPINGFAGDTTIDVGVVCAWPATAHPSSNAHTPAKAKKRCPARAPATVPASGTNLFFFFRKVAARSARKLRSMVLREDADRNAKHARETEPAGWVVMWISPRIGAAAE